MRDRIIGALRVDGGRPASEGPPAWRELRDRIGDIAISTIDAFCLSLLARVSPRGRPRSAFRVADETMSPNWPKRPSTTCFAWHEGLSAEADDHRPRADDHSRPAIAPGSSGICSVVAWWRRASWADGWGQMPTVSPRKWPLRGAAFGASRDAKGPGLATRADVASAAGRASARGGPSWSTSARRRAGRPNAPPRVRASSADSRRNARHARAIGEEPFEVTVVAAERLRIRRGHAQRPLPR